MSKAKDMLSQLACLNGMMATYGEMARIDAEDRAYLAKTEREKEQARYRQSKEYRDARAKKKAQRKLRKKSQGR